MSKLDRLILQLADDYRHYTIIDKPEKATQLLKVMELLDTRATRDIPELSEPSLGTTPDVKEVSND